MSGAAMIEQNNTFKSRLSAPTFVHSTILDRRKVPLNLLEIIKKKEYI